LPHLTFDSWQAKLCLINTFGGVKMKENLVVLIVLASLLFFADRANAELLGGKVINVDSTSNTLIINQTNWETEAQENISVQIVNETALMGVESFSSIKVGDEVWVEAEEDYATNNWVASSLQRIKDETLKSEEAGTSL